MTTFKDQLESLPPSVEAQNIILTVEDTFGRTVAVDGVKYQVGDMGPRFKFRLPDTFYVRSTKQDEDQHQREWEATISDAEGDHLTVKDLAFVFHEHPDGRARAAPVTDKFGAARVHIEDEEGRITAPVSVVAIKAADGKMNLRLRLPPRHAIFDMNKFHTGGPVRQRPPVDPLTLRGVTEATEGGLRSGTSFVASLMPKTPSAVVHGPPLNPDGNFDNAFLAIVYGEMLGSGIDEHVCRKALTSIDFAWRAFKSMNNLGNNPPAPPVDFDDREREAGWTVLRAKNVPIPKWLAYFNNDLVGTIVKSSEPGRKMVFSPIHGGYTPFEDVTVATVLHRLENRRRQNIGAS